MSRKFWALTLLLAVLIAFAATWAVAEDEHPDPRPVTPMEVDPDGLEGLNAPSGNVPTNAVFDENPWFSFFRVLIRQARLVGF